MLSHRRFFLSLPVALLPLLTACNQTAVPEASGPAAPGVIGSSAMAAISEAHTTRMRHIATSNVLNKAAGFDRTGIAAAAVAVIEEKQAQIEEEQARRVDEEIEKLVVEAEALLVDFEKREQEEARAAKRAPSHRKPAP